MKDRTRDILNQILDAHDQNCSVVQRRNQDAERQAIEFLIDFDRLMQDVLEPAVAEMDQVLRARGHELRSLYRANSVGAVGATPDRSMVVRLLLAGVDPKSDDHPTFSFLASKNTERIRMESDSGTERQLRGDLAIGQIDRGLVDRQLLEWLRLSLASPS